MATIEKFEQLPNGKWRPIVGKPSAVAYDEAPVAYGSLQWFKQASESEVAVFMSKRRNKALDTAADDEIRNLFPKLKKMAKDNAAAEAKALGLESEEDEDATANDEEETSIAERVTAGYKAARGFWKKSATRNRQRSQFASATGRYLSATATDSASVKPSKHDLVAANAKSAQQTSMFKRF